MYGYWLIVRLCMWSIIRASRDSEMSNNPVFLNSKLPNFFVPLNVKFNAVNQRFYFHILTFTP